MRISIAHDWAETANMAIGNNMVVKSTGYSVTMSTQMSVAPLRRSCAMMTHRLAHLSLPSYRTPTSTHIRVGSIYMRTHLCTLAARLFGARPMYVLPCLRPPRPAGTP